MKFTTHLCGAISYMPSCKFYSARIWAKRVILPKCVETAFLCHQEELSPGTHCLTPLVCLVPPVTDLSYMVIINPALLFWLSNSSVYHHKTNVQ